MGANHNEIKFNATCSKLTIYTLHYSIKHFLGVFRRSQEGLISNHNKLVPSVYENFYIIYRAVHKAEFFHTFQRKSLSRIHPFRLFGFPEKGAVPIKECIFLHDLIISEHLIKTPFYTILYGRKCYFGRSSNGRTHSSGE